MNFIDQVMRSSEGRAYFSRAARGTSGSMVKIDRALLEDFPLFLPPLSEQRKIAIILSCVDEAIEKSDAVVDQLHVIEETIGAELLPQGLPGSHSSFRQTSLGMVPKDWDVVRVKEIGKVTYGLTVNGSRRGATERLPYLTVATLQESGFDLSSVKEIGVLAGDHERYGLVNGDVLIVEGNANPRRLGCAAVWEGQIANVLHQNHLIRVRPCQGRIEPQWLALAINAPSGRVQIEAATKTSSGLHTINSTVVSDLLIPLPPLAEQRYLCAVLDSIKRSRATEKCVRECRSALKSAILESFLSGKVRPNTATPPQ